MLHGIQAWMVKINEEVSIKIYDHTSSTCIIKILCFFIVLQGESSLPQKTVITVHVPL
jgi:hypothetical protein